MFSWLFPAEGEISRDGRRVRVPMAVSDRLWYALAGIALIASSAWLGVAADPVGLFWLLPMPVLGVIALWKAVLKPLEWRLTPEGNLAAEVAAREQADRSFELDAKIARVVRIWYVRYLLAFLICWFLYENVLPRGLNGKTAILLVGGLGLAAWLAREIALVVLVLGALFWLFAMLADFELTTPRAVLIGAIIIAIAIVHGRSKRS